MRALLPTTMDPFIAGGAFTYHWGFHGQLAWLAWLFGQTDPFALAGLLLQAGQWFNVLSVLHRLVGGLTV